MVQVCQVKANCETGQGWKTQCIRIMRNKWGNSFIHSYIHSSGLQKKYNCNSCQATILETKLEEQEEDDEEEKELYIKIHKNDTEQVWTSIHSFIQPCIFFRFAEKVCITWQAALLKTKMKEQEDEEEGKRAKWKKSHLQAARNCLA